MRGHLEDVRFEWGAPLASDPYQDLEERIMKGDEVGSWMEKEGSDYGR